MRHAQNHWLKLQADMAIDVATTIDMGKTEEGVKDYANKIDATLPYCDIECFALQHDQAICDAAVALVKAELYHREIVRRGGQLTKK